MPSTDNPDVFSDIYEAHDHCVRLLGRLKRLRIGCLPVTKEGLETLKPIVTQIEHAIDDAISEAGD